MNNDAALQQIARLREKAEAGDAGSQNAFGEMYLYGEGVAENYVEAVKWITRAAEQGLVEAQYQIGLFYHYGDGVDQDDVEAYAWCSLSAENGYNLAVKRRDETEKTMRTQQLCDAKKRIKELKKIIADIKSGAK